MNTVQSIDELINTNKFTGDREHLCQVIELMCHVCPDSAVISFITFRSQHNVKSSNPDWIQYVANLMTKFYQEEIRPKVRLHMLELLQTTVKKYLGCNEDKVLETCVLPYLSDLQLEVDNKVKVMAVKTVSILAAETCGAHLTDLLDLLENNILKQIYLLTPEMDASDKLVVDDYPYLHEAVMGIIKVFKSKFFHPPISVVKRCYEVLVTVLDRFYSVPGLLEPTGNTRYEIFRCFLSLRARQDFHLGYHKEFRGCVVFSPFVVCESKQGIYAKDKDMLVLSLTRACRAVIRCFKEEKDWRVLKLLLNEVPNVLQNRGMLLRYEESISKLAESMCGLIQSGYKLPDINVPSKFTRNDFYLTVYPVLSSLASYNRWLQSDIKRRLVESLESGLTSKECSKVCTVALTSCILEMSESMNSYLPDVLANLSKISATVHVSIPVLEFLSTLITLPKAFASFNNNQYMSVFAITLPYTNPFKFDHYTVSLAHHVIIMWFLKCRLASRKDFIKFIVKGLEGNALQPFEEGNFRKRDLSSLNEDSTGRGRSSSLNEQSRPTRSRHMTGVPQRPQHLHGPDERQALHTFHQELTQTCIDMMTRYCTSNPTLEPERTSLANILLKSGTSTSWIIDTAILTISVSGCNGSAVAGQSTSTTGQSTNQCQSCTKGCEQADLLNDQIQKKKRHFSEQPARSRVLPPLMPLHQDDVILRHRSRGGASLQPASPLTPDSESTNMMVEQSLQPISELSLQQPKVDQDVDLGSLEDLRELCESFDENEISQDNDENEGNDENLVDGNVKDETVDDHDMNGDKKDLDGSEQTVEDSDGNACACWCQGWCQILIRRPSGEMCWMFRLHNGQIANQNFCLKDISDILFPSPQIETKIKVNRSNSDPEIMDTVSPLDLNRLKKNYDPIPEEGNTAGARAMHRHRARSNTIDSSSPTKPVKRMERLMTLKSKQDEITPENMLDQLLLTAGMTTADYLSADQCLAIPKSRQFDTSLRILDMMPCQETHKIGVIYVGGGQANNESAILSNTYGSARYQSFLTGLGRLISLDEVNTSKIFLGGLSQKDGDGDSAYVWLDDAMQVVYHTATLMPNRETDPNFNKKKRHIGNDYVAIVYNESGESYQMGTVKGQFIYATVVVEPLAFETNRISVLAKPELSQFLSHLTQGKVVTDWNLSMLVRQIALHCNLAANIYSNIEKKADLYASNWLERLRHIKRLKVKVQKELDESYKDYNII